MPLAVTHVVSTVILVDIYRDYILKDRKLFSLHTIFIAGIFGLLPDTDMIFGMVADIFRFKLPLLLQHGGITHTPLFALVFLIPGLILWNFSKKKYAVYCFVGVFGMMWHLFLDWLLGGGAYEGIMWLYPFSMHQWKLHLLLNLGVHNIPMALDAIILLLWLWHEEEKHKISDFI